MFSLVFGVILLLASLLARVLIKFDKETTNPAVIRIKNIASYAVGVIGVAISLSGAFSYNDAGWNQHVRTVFGTESSVHTTGWYFSGWGTSTAWPDYITVANTTSIEAEGSAISGPYRVRLADNWTGDVTQTTRFGIPKDTEQFLAMARVFRSPERLITTTLKPAVTASMDSIANMFSMEEYYAGGKRDQFKSEYKDAIEKGRPVVRQVIDWSQSGVQNQRNAANDSENAADTSEVGDTNVQRFKMEKVTDSSGNVRRETHDYAQYGIVVSSAILENLDPDDAFEMQIKARKDAASRRIVAREERLEQEEQRLLAIQTGQTDIAKRQAAAQVEQIQQTTEADTKKKLALIEAERVREAARIAQETSLINLEKAKIDAQAVQVTADAEAYQKRVILEADGALQQKLDAWVTSQQYWADAASKINVPTTVFATGGEGSTAGNALGTVDAFMQMMTMKAAQDLQVNPTITK